MQTVSKILMTPKPSKVGHLFEKSNLQRTPTILHIVLSFSSITLVYRKEKRSQIEEEEGYRVDREIDR